MKTRRKMNFKEYLKQPRRVVYLKEYQGLFDLQLTHTAQLQNLKMEKMMTLQLQFPLDFCSALCNNCVCSVPSEFRGLQEQAITSQFVYIS